MSSATAEGASTPPVNSEPKRLALFMGDAPALELLDLEGTEARIVDAARRCMLQYGSGKTGVIDVARAADVSRGSVYRYFSDRDKVVEAVTQLAFSAFTADLDDAMSEQDCLEDQLVAAAVVTRRWNQAKVAGGGASFLRDDELAFLYVRGSRPVMIMMIDIIRKHLELARQRGEVRAGVDLDRTAEWVARILHSLSVNRPIGFDADDPEDLEDFIRTHLVYGFGERAGSP